MPSCVPRKPVNSKEKQKNKNIKNHQTHDFLFFRLDHEKFNG